MQGTRGMPPVGGFAQMIGDRFGGGGGPRRAPGTPGGNLLSTELAAAGQPGPMVPSGTPAPQMNAPPGAPGMMRQAPMMDRSRLLAAMNPRRYG